MSSPVTSPTCLPHQLSTKPACKFRYSPTRCTPESPCPVLQWIYGGAWVLGSNEEFGMYDGEELSNKWVTSFSQETNLKLFPHLVSLNILRDWVCNIIFVVDKPCSHNNFSFLSFLSLSLACNLFVTDSWVLFGFVQCCGNHSFALRSAECMWNLYESSIYFPTSLVMFSHWSTFLSTVWVTRKQWFWLEWMNHT